MLATYQFRATMGYDEVAIQKLRDFDYFYYEFERIKGNWIQTNEYRLTKTYYLFTDYNGIVVEYYNELKGYKENKYFDSKNEEFKSFVFSRFIKYRQDLLIINKGLENKNNLISKIKKLRGLIK
ncbi:hypothetical protein [Cetobacterium sp.]|uniref:hypothetical protein n=1 Tax=Cetobacterium sp. TaxID=2071632 RepID=UPI003F37CB6D